jgi:hypothetical protein
MPNPRRLHPYHRAHSKRANARARNPVRWPPFVAATDALVDAYVVWREECVRVHLAYRRCNQRESAERDLAFAAYSAALQREEGAANAYARQIERVRRLAPRGREDEAYRAAA